jgi:hypothetical protein
MLLYIGIGLIGTGLWIAYEIYRAPYYDEEKNIFYDKNQHNSTEGVNNETPNSRAQRNQASTKRGKKTKGN